MVAIDELKTSEIKDALVYVLSLAETSVYYNSKDYDKELSIVEAIVMNYIEEREKIKNE